MLISPSSLEPVDYLVIGHLTQDITPHGLQLGGTASYAALTARALGLRVGIITSSGPEADLSALDGIQVVSMPTERSSTFENIHTPTGRIQYLYHVAPVLTAALIPDVWRSTPLVHLGPVCQEIDTSLLRAFPDSFIGITPQGWLRCWDKDGRVKLCDWPESAFVLGHVSAAVLSIEDVQGKEDRIEEMLSAVRVLVVTEGAAGARVYWNGDMRYFTPPAVVEMDPVGAGDIFAASFFHRMALTRDPWESARFATLVAANSVTRKGKMGIPTPEEVRRFEVDVVEPGGIS